MLVRRFVNASFRLLMRAEWDEEIVKEYTSIMSSRGGPLWYASHYMLQLLQLNQYVPVFSSEDTRVPSSLTYHLADIYLEELNKALANPPSPSPLPAPLSTLLSPYFTLAARTLSNITYQRIQSALIDPLFISLSSEDTDDSDNAYEHIVENSCSSNPREEGPLDQATLKKTLVKRLFDIASEQDTRDSNRRKLYAVWKTYIDDDADDHPLDAS